jgi:hypothetical protein
MAPLKPQLGFNFFIFFCATPCPLPIINLNLVDVETLSTSPNNDPLETLSKGKHKASNIVVFQVNFTSLVE